MKELPERRRTFAWAGSAGRTRSIPGPVLAAFVEGRVHSCEPNRHLDLKTLMICGASASTYVSREIAALQ